MSKANDKRLDSYLAMPSDLGSRAENKVRSEREQMVQKSNELIRKFKAEMNTPQFKITLYLISKAYTLDNELEYTFNIKDFCQCCGLDDDNGNNYRRLKREIRNLRNKSQWVEVWGDPDTEVLVSLVSKAWFNARSGKVRIRLDEDIKPYILELRKNWEQKGELYTKFALLYTLPMKSLYSIRLYELLKSWADATLSENEGHWWEISQLQALLGSEYERYQDFRRYVIETALKEINKYSDISVQYEPVKEGRSYKYINFYIRNKTEQELISVKANNHHTLDGLQMSFDDYGSDGKPK
jgi:plasmid replication initiation protein